MELNRKYQFDQSCFKVIDNEQKAYWLGMLMADGHVRIRKSGNSFCLTSIDVDHLEKFKSFLKHPGEIKPHNGNCFRFEVYSSSVVKDLINLGIVPRKSLCASIPNIPCYLIRDFIRGVFDGDGSIGYYGKSWRFTITSATPLFINNLKSIIEDNGIKGHIDYRDSVDNLVYGGNGVAYKFGRYLYDNSTIYLDRKYRKYLELRKHVENPVVELIIKTFRVCNISKCNNSQYAKGLCRYHYDQKRHCKENFNGIR